MKSIIYIFSILMFSNTAFGQDYLSFNDCLDIVTTNNLSLKSAMVSEEIAVYRKNASYGQLLPSIYGTASNKKSWGRAIDPKTNLFVEKNLNNYKGNIEAVYNLFSGFAVINSIKLAKQEVEINKVNVKRVENEITIDLAQKFITILYLQEIVIANQEQIKTSEKQLELAVLKFNSGTIAESEVFKIKSQKAAEELNLITNQSYLTDNFISLKQLMNVPLEIDIRLLKPNLDLNKNLELNEKQFILTNKTIEINHS